MTRAYYPSSPTKEAMVGRSLLSLLAIAAVAIQSCVAVYLPDGLYRIELPGYGPLSADAVDSGTLLNVFYQGEIQEWDVRNADRDLIEIIVYSSIGPRYVAPARQGIDVVLSDKPFQWHLVEVEDGYILERPDFDEEDRVLSLSPYRIYPPRAANIRRGSLGLPQVWLFKHIDNFYRNTNCGPRRLSRDSLYIQ
ncbi:hypothetical protein BGX34_006899 [Mortierella sp. NVP85]|nr:hypothetical protein BGX34_006899 [Mortierella sp. NVP85]